MSDYMGKGVIDSGCSRFLIGQNTFEKWEQMLTRRWGLSTQRIQLAGAMTLRFGNDETLETRTPCWKCRSQWSTACVCGTWGSAALAVERIFERLRLPH